MHVCCIGKAITSFAKPLAFFSGPVFVLRVLSAKSPPQRDPETPQPKLIRKRKKISLIFHRPLLYRHMYDISKNSNQFIRPIIHALKWNKRRKHQEVKSRETVLSPGVGIAEDTRKGRKEFRRPHRSRARATTTTTTTYYHHHQKWEMWPRTSIPKAARWALRRIFSQEPLGELLRYWLVW